MMNVKMSGKRLWDDARKEALAELRANPDTVSEIEKMIEGVGDVIIHEIKNPIIRMGAQVLFHKAVEEFFDVDVPNHPK